MTSAVANTVCTTPCHSTRCGQSRWIHDMSPHSTHPPRAIGDSHLKSYRNRVLPVPNARAALHPVCSTNSPSSLAARRRSRRQISTFRACWALLQSTCVQHTSRCLVAKRESRQCRGPAPRVVPFQSLFRRQSLRRRLQRVAISYFRCTRKDVAGRKVGIIM